MYYIRAPESEPFIYDLQDKRLIYSGKEGYLFDDEVKASIELSLSEIPSDSNIKFIFGLLYESNPYVVDAVEVLSVSCKLSYLERLSSISRYKIMPVILSANILFEDEVYALRVMDNYSALDENQYSLNIASKFYSKVEVTEIKKNIYLDLINKYIHGDKNAGHE